MDKKTIYDNALRAAHKEYKELKGKVIQVSGPIGQDRINKLLELGAIIIMKGAKK